jgi:hypothetical protein
MTHLFFVVIVTGNLATVARMFSHFHFVQVPNAEISENEIFSGVFSGAGDG